MKKLILLTAALSVFTLAGCASSSYSEKDRAVLKEEVRPDGTINRTFEGQGRGVEQAPEVYRQETHNSTHDSSYREGAALKEACKSFPDHPKCQ